jgi:hypothetical protein
VPGDDETDYYYDYRCNPLNGRCNFMKVLHNSTVCLSKVNAISVKVNGAVASSGGAAFPYTINAVDVIERIIFPGPSVIQLVVPPDVEITVEVKDQFGRPLADVPVMLKTVNGKLGGFLSEDEEHINCGSATGHTDENGIYRKKWLWTWNSQDQSYVNIGVTVTDYAMNKSFSSPVQLLVMGPRAFPYIDTYTKPAFDDDDLRCRP